MFLVSAIIPNYNHAFYLKQRIESVLSQTYQNFELIILDDCSTDNSRAIIEQYRDHPLVTQIVYNTDNSGSPFKQWHKGITLAKGDLIWIAESDDYCEKVFLETIINKYKELDSNNISLIYSDSYEVNNINDIFNKASKWASNLSNDRWCNDFISEGNFEIDNYLSVINTIPNASAVVFKKDRYYEITPSFDLKMCGDWLTWIKIIKNSNFAYISQPLNYFRFHTNTTRANASYKIKLKTYENYKVLNFAHKFRNNKSKFDEIGLTIGFSYWSINNRINFIKNFSFRIFVLAFRVDKLVLRRLLKVLFPHYFVN